MQIIHKNLKKGEIKLKPQNIDDLWYLSTIIDKGDLIKGYTIRKIKAGGNEKQEASRKKVFIILKAEKIEFKENILKVLGVIEEGTELVQKGEHHSFNIEENNIITIIKEQWLKFQLDRLRDASEAKQPEILVCIFDREEALFALTKKNGYTLLAAIKGEVQKKDEKAVAKGSFYAEIEVLLEEYSQRYKSRNIVLASPAFWKEELLKHLKNKELKSKIVQAACSSVDKTAINEVLKRPEVREVFRRERFAMEINLVEELLIEISKNNLAVYGLKETEKAVNAGAVSRLLITDDFIKEMRQKENYNKLEYLMKSAESMKGDVYIICSGHEGGKRLDGLGGIGAILRYKVNY